MGQISKEGAGCFWTFWGIGGILTGLKVLFTGQLDGEDSVPRLLGLFIIAGSILFIKYAGRAMWKGSQPFNQNKKGVEPLNKNQKADAEKIKQVCQNPMEDSNKSIDGNIEKLEKLKSLLDAGILTQDEFDKKKKSILEKI